jgi:hypothetical protein
MSSQTKKSIKDREPKSSESRIAEKNDEVREKRQAKLESVREKDTVSLKTTTGNGNSPFHIKITQREAAPKIKPRQYQQDLTAEQQQENAKLLYTRMQQYCERLGESAMKSQLEELKHNPNAEVKATVYYVDPKMYGRKKKLFKITSDNGPFQVHGFVDPLNGDLYKPSGRTPSKNPIHNLMDDDSFHWVLDNCTYTGSELYLSNARRDYVVN